LDGQVWLLDYLKSIEPKENTKADFVKGDTIYKIVLDVIETGVIDHFWKCYDYMGYSAKRLGGNCFITFWTPNINNTVFRDYEQALKKSQSLRDTYKVIRKEEMKVTKEQGFIREWNNGNWEATVKILENNMLYYKEFCCYPFLEIFTTPEKVEKRFREKCNEIMKDINGNVIKSDVDIMLEDMYKTKNGNWSCYTYAEHNGAITNG
jgi:hypothetical protein